MLRRIAALLRHRQAARGPAAHPGLPPPDPAPVSVHADPIRALFDDRVGWAGDTPGIDRPLLVLAFTNRSGSNLLADYLLQTGTVGGLGEYLLHETVRRQSARHGIDNAPDYLRRLAAGCRGDQQFGIKASAEQLQLLIDENLPAMFTRCCVVHIHRDDLVGQAVSHWIARQTGQWTSRQARHGEADRYDAGAMLRITTDVVHQDASIRRQCALAEMPYLSLSYEELTFDPGAALRRIAAKAGLALGDWSPGPPRIERQADARNEAMRQRLIRDAGRPNRG